MFLGREKAVGGSCDPMVCELSSCPRPRSLSVVGGGAPIGNAHSTVLMDERLTFASGKHTDRPGIKVINLTLWFPNKMVRKANVFRGSHGVASQIKSSLIRAGL